MAVFSLPPRLSASYTRSLCSKVKYAWARARDAAAKRERERETEKKTRQKRKERGGQGGTTETRLLCARRRRRRRRSRPRRTYGTWRDPLMHSIRRLHSTYIYTRVPYVHIDHVRARLTGERKPLKSLPSDALSGKRLGFRAISARRAIGSRAHDDVDFQTPTLPSFLYFRRIFKPPFAVSASLYHYLFLSLSPRNFFGNQK